MEQEHGLQTQELQQPQTSFPHTTMVSNPDSQPSHRDGAVSPLDSSTKVKRDRSKQLISVPSASSFQFSSSKELQRTRQLSFDGGKKPPIHSKLRREPSGHGKDFLQKSHSDPSNRNRTSRNPFALHRRRGSPVSKCILTLDGYSYVIVASPPDKSGGVAAAASPRDEGPLQYPASTGSKNGQLSKQGSLTILRRSSSRSLGRTSRISAAGTPEEAPETVQDLEADPENPEAVEKAVARLKSLLRRLRQGDAPTVLFQQDLQYAIEVLENCYLEDIRSGDQSDQAITISLGSPTSRGSRSSSSSGVRTSRRQAEEEDELSEVEPDAVPPEVREWLASTFTRQLSGGRRKNDEKPKFRSVANAIRAGIFVERIYRRLCSATFMQLPPEVSKVLKKVDSWDFDIFVLQETSNNTPLRCISYELLSRYGLLHKFKVPPSSLEAFLNQMESGYCKFKNPYHNNCHAADVLQTIHYMLCQTGLMNWLTDLEILATLVAAMVHDYEHTGTTNNFHVMSGSETALLYNDRAVLENHHISAAFRLLQEEGNNMLVNLSRAEYREFRGLVIEMVLATDMSSHFQQIKAMKAMLTLPDRELDKSKALSMVLHCCDISHPSKHWEVHERWTKQLLEEFFRQGDREHELGLPYSPLCDRKNTLVAQSQIGFIDFIVDPSMSVCSDLLDKVASMTSSTTTNAIAEEPSSEGGGPIRRPILGKEIKRPWLDCLLDNKSKWKERASLEDKARAEQAAKEAAEADSVEGKSLSSEQSTTEASKEEATP